MIPDRGLKHNLVMCLGGNRTHSNQVSHAARAVSSFDTVDYLYAFKEKALEIV